MSDLETALTSQVGSRPPEAVTELMLDGCKLQSSSLAGLAKFTGLTKLSLNGCSLTSLDGFPTLDNLKSLELTDNQLSDGLDALQDAGLLALTRLSLAGNRFATLDALEPLSGLVFLNDLDLYHCPVTEVEGYRASIFDMLGNLKYLDGFDADDNEKDEDDDDDGDADDLLSSEVGDEDDDDDDLGEDDDDEGEDGEDDEGEDGEDDDDDDDDDYDFSDDSDDSDWHPIWGRDGHEPDGWQGHASLDPWRNARHDGRQTWNAWRAHGWQDGDKSDVWQEQDWHGTRRNDRHDGWPTRGSDGHR